MYTHNAIGKRLSMGVARFMRKLAPGLIALPLLFRAGRLLLR